MATLKFTGSGHWVVNVFHDWNHPDPDYELVSPNKSVNVAINHTPTYITLYVSAPPGTPVSLELNGAVIIQGVTKANGLYMGHYRAQ